MKLPLFIAFRYLISKKKHNIINIISSISIAGITFGTMALIIVLSVFNGFESLIVSMFNAVNPDLQITAVQGKTFTLDSIQSQQIKKIKGIVYYTEVIEENVLLKYNDKQHIAVIKGVSNDFFRASSLCDLTYNGSCTVKEGNVDFALISSGVAVTLEINLDNYINLLGIYVPRRGTTSVTDPAKAFSYKQIIPGGFFETKDAEYDSKYFITDIGFARSLLSYTNEVSALEIGIDRRYNVSDVKNEIIKLLGKDFNVKNRYEQQALMYKVMKSEKWAIFLILTFILIIAVFNVIGTLTMLVLEKKNDISVLWTLGAEQSLLKKIFFFEGLLINFTGAIIGIVAGGFICWLQQTYGLIALENAQSFVVESYPVKMKIFDFGLVFCTVMFIGALASYLPVRNLNIQKIERGK
ncbi:MAG: Lipoprotein-releasing system transmembrane protein LolE [Bacteroidetes bacterium ADurb.Bin408]|nr:MAG: Lipoprotein-releasing system transmembrane protein LolE [Bacteroidetes bacterium ADurb.Bin408]